MVARSGASRTSRRARGRRVRACGILALLTDFGTRDPYVGTMKGVILSVHPRARIVDLSHDVRPQDVVGAYFLLEHTYQYFPDGTVFVGVVDPGVGTERRILAVEGRRHFFLAPDNGLLSFLVRRDEVARAFAITNSRYFLQPVSNTFHGRDIFAPVAAHLARGLDPARLGPQAGPIVRLDQPAGRIVSIDRFGNLVTNIPGDQLRGASAVELARARRARPVRTYAEGREGELIALVGSHGTVELAIRNANAAEQTAATVGARVEIVR